MFFGWEINPQSQEPPKDLIFLSEKETSIHCQLCHRLATLKHYIIENPDGTVFYPMFVKCDHCDVVIM